MARTIPFIRAVLVAASALALNAACGGEERRPNVPASGTVTDLRRSGGDAVQDCGESSESRTETACRIHPVGECLLSALKACRPAYGVRSYFTSEGDPIRYDWLVLSDGHGGCEVVTVEDKSADPLARKEPKVSHCKAIVWKHHESIPDCEAPVADDCSVEKKPEKDADSDEGDKS
ncbi:MAG TPA: hypothetical protein VHE30_27645 [Polyangiaceae bacterium]|nr:hypothetical protein [Polyangiaceae bacterium]